MPTGSTSETQTKVNSEAVKKESSKDTVTKV